MKAAGDLLVSAVREQRPIILFLGQDAWADPKLEDPILVKALDKLDRTTELQRGWRGLIGPSPVPPSYYEWLAERFERRVYPSWLTVLNELPWNAVFTTAIDPKLKNLLQDRGREPEVVLTANETPRTIRSTARPPIYFLFGLAGSSEPQTRPPANRSGLNVRRIDHALPILGRMLDTATTLGLVVVDGFVSDRDWLKIDDLLGTLGRATEEQVLWFGGCPQLESEDAADFEDATNSRRIVVENARLGTILAELFAVGRLPEFTSPESQEAGIVTFASGAQLVTTAEERLRVEATVSIVDDSWTAFLPPLGSDAEYDVFRRFHGDLEGARLLVEGVRREFAIERDFERRLLAMITKAVTDHAEVDEPIVVHGQSGTGKSVALARIAVAVREMKAAAVLYTKGRIPQPQEIVGFCERAEKAGAPATLIICDSNREIETYRELLLSLRSRGRRTVVLGSRYRIAYQSGQPSPFTVEAPATLTRSEGAKLRNLLFNFLPQEFNLDITRSDRFLAFLYRILPYSRARIASGLGAEARAAENLLRKTGREVQKPIPDTQLAQKLIEAGFAIGDRPFFDDRQFDALESGHTTGRIIDFVMVAGRLECPVPVNLLLRAVTSSLATTDVVWVAKIFRDLDLFRWKWANKEKNELLVLPRLTLEADLICRRRLGNPDKEAERLVELISAVRGSGIDASHEHGFLLNLLQQIGSNGPRGSLYKKWYAKIARALTELRFGSAVVHASLMLQESSFRRAAVRENIIDDSDRLNLLEEARDAVQAALDGIADGSISAPKRTQQNLYVERASLYGFLAYDRARVHASSNEVWSSYEAARSAIHRAVSVTDNYYPLDVGLWTPSDMIKIANLTELQRAELVADIYNRLDQVDIALLPPNQRERFEARRMKVGSVLKDHVLTEDAYDKLEAGGYTAGYFLRARELAPELRKEPPDDFGADECARAAQAAQFLKSRFSRIENDERCLLLLLECQWVAKMARRPLRGERQPLPVDSTIRHEFHQTIQTLNQVTGDATRHVTTYLEAVLAWLTGDENGATRRFRELARETEYENPGRVVRRHMITDHEQKPQRFSGRVVQKRSDGHWRVVVDGMDMRVDLLSKDFPREDIAYGRSLNEFAIAFNFIGPIADPIGRRR